MWPLLPPRAPPLLEAPTPISTAASSPGLACATRSRLRSRSSTLLVARQEQARGARGHQVAVELGRALEQAGVGEEHVDGEGLAPDGAAEEQRQESRSPRYTLSQTLQGASFQILMSTEVSRLKRGAQH